MAKEEITGRAAAASRKRRGLPVVEEKQQTAREKAGLGSKKTGTIGYQIGNTKVSKEEFGTYTNKGGKITPERRAEVEAGRDFSLRDAAETKRNKEIAQRNIDIDEAEREIKSAKLDATPKPLGAPILKEGEVGGATTDVKDKQFGTKAIDALERTHIAGVQVGGVEIAGVESSVGLGVKGALAIATATALGGIGLLAATKIAGTIAGIDVITTWFAADNGATGAKIQSNVLVANVRNGQISPADAMIEQERLLAVHEESQNFIRTSTIVNPTLWPFAAFYNFILDQQRLDMDANTEILRQY